MTTGRRVSISTVAPLRSRGSTVARSARIRARSPGALPNGFVWRASIRASITSAGALNSTTASKRS